MGKIKLICMLLVAMAGMTSCLSSSDNETTTYTDGAISYFALGTMNRYIHTTNSTGGDSIYKTTFTGSSYAFHIDQINRRIFNTDSLPIGTDVAHVLVSLSTKNNGVVLIQNLEDENTLTYYSTTDSIDFTNPRKFLVYPSDGSGEKSEYTVQLNVHKEVADSFVWHQRPNSEILKSLCNVEAQYWNGDIYVSGDLGDLQKTYKLEADGELTEFMSSANVLPEGIKKWIGVTSKEVYALSTDNRLMISRDRGKTFEEDSLDEDASMLPVQDIAFVSYSMYYATNTEYALMVGNRSVDTYPQEKTAMVWRKIVDNDEHTPEGIWTYMAAAKDAYALPRLQHLSLVYYDDGILAIGGACYGEGVISAPYDCIYQSRDNGITWKNSTAYQLPDGFDSTTTSVGMLVDDEYNLWLFCGGTGQIWRGRLNKMAWQFWD